MGVAEAVAFSGLSRTRLFALIRDRQVTSVRLGRKRLIFKASLIAFLESQASGRSQSA